MNYERKFSYAQQLEQQDFLDGCNLEENRKVGFTFGLLVKVI
jgi:hypothetical protein